MRLRMRCLRMNNILCILCLATNMYFIIVLVILLLAVLLVYYLLPKKRDVKEEKEKINRCATKCFDCVNNSQSLTYLNVSHGYPRVYAT